MLVDRSDRRHHDLNVLACGEIADLPELAGIVDEVIVWHPGVEALQVIHRVVQRCVEAFLDRDRRHDDHVLGEAIALVELEDGAQVNIGLAGAGLHLHGEIAGRERRRRRQTVAELDGVQVRQQLIVQQCQPITDAEVVFKQGHLPTGGVARDSEFRPAGLLAVEKTADR